MVIVEGVLYAGPLFSYFWFGFVYSSLWLASGLVSYCLYCMSGYLSPLPLSLGWEENEESQVF